MAFLIGLFILAMAAIVGAPDTPFGKSLRDWLVERPARAIGKMTPAKIAVGAIVAVLLVGMAMSAPEIVAMIGFADLTVYLDATVILSLLAAAARVKFVAQQSARFGRALARRLIVRSHRSPSRPRQTQRRRRGSPPPSGEADPHAGLAFA